MEEGRLLTIIAILMANPHVSEDLRWLDETDIADLVEKLQSHIPKSNYVYKNKGQKAKDKTNAFNILFTTALHIKVVLFMLPLLWVKGMVLFEEFKCDWNEEGFFLR